MIVTYTVMTLQAFHTKCVQDFTTLRALTINQPLQVHFKGGLQIHQKMFLSLVNRKDWFTTLLGNWMKISFTILTCHIAGHMEQSLQGADPMC